MTDESLSMRWPGGQLDADAQGPVTIGRDPASSVILASPAVSRRHGHVFFADGTWWYADLGSAQGSFVDGVPVDRVALARPTRVVLGRGPEAVVVELVPPHGVQDLVGTAPGSWAGGQGLALTRPVSPASPPPAAPTVKRDPPEADDLRVEVAGHTRVLPAGGRLSVGRESDNDLVLDTDSVSRHHLVVEQVGGAWTVRDLGSTAGTWLDETRVGTHSLRGRQTFRLGDRARGVLLTTSAPGALPTAAGRLRRRSVLALVGVLVLALAGGAVGYRLLRVSDTDLARATVKVTMTLDGAPYASGSGTIVDRRRGLVLTNAHVAADHAPGRAVASITLADDLGPEQDGIVIAVTDGLQKTAESRFRGRVVAADGYLDLAVVQITQTLTGAQVEADDLAGLTELALGDSDDVRSGQRVRVLGYPGLANSEAPTLTEGIASGVQTDPRLRSNRAWINDDAASNHGNSGGLAADTRGRVVGVPTLGLLDRQTHSSTLAAFRPVNFAKPLIEAAQAGTPYVSPWTTPAPPAAKVSAVGLVTAGTAAVSTGCAAGQQTAGAPSFGVEYSGFGNAENTDLLATLDRRSADGTTWSTIGEASNLFAFPRSFPTRLPDTGCLTLTFAPLEDDETFPAGPYRLRIGLGGSLTTIATYEVSYPG
jgi:pSer/pThr/pTyr-binding forkhead associated (FHA) protein